MIEAIIGGVITAAIIGAGAGLWKLFSKRIRLAGPTQQAIVDLQKTVAELVPNVNCLLSVQAPQIQALVALLEASKGQVNGNVDRALDAARKAGDQFEAHLCASAQIKEASR